MAVVTRPHLETGPSLLNRPLNLARVNIELLSFVLVVLLSVIAHLYGLGRMALHHDESIHAWMSWKLFVGAGGFTCYGGRTIATYCYEPTYHGPSLYMLTLASYFLFGDGDWQARMPQALAGIGMVASAWMLRPLIGNRAALIAAVLLGFAPSLLYYTRFARHDGLILLWTLWIVIGFFRFIQSQRARFLYLMAAGISLAIATHELYYILGFIFGWFLIIRLAFERLPFRLVNRALLALLGLMVIVELWNPSITPTVRAGGMALLLLTVTSTGLFMIRTWEPAPLVSTTLAAVWRERRSVVWGALAIFTAIYVLLYSTFFADPQSLLSGLYAGLAYWLGSQQHAARGDQPWYYHLILMTIYEPLALFGGIGTAVYLYTRGLSMPEQKSAATQASESQEGADEGASAEPAAVSVPTPRLVVPLFPLFLSFWFLTALVAFSWAGEKMPWLVTHISLPGNLLVAWALGRLIDVVPWRNTAQRRLLLVPAVLSIALIALGIAYWRFSTASSDQAGQSGMVQGLVPLAVAAGLLYFLLTIGQRTSWRSLAALAGLTLAALLGAGMVRATWMVVYDHPDTPIEPLVYVQSSPDVPLIVKDLRELAINQTRNIRDDNDPVGGLTMPVIMDSGDPGGEGSLAWPYQWYFRDFKRIENRNSEFFRTATPDAFIVDPIQPGAERALAPAVMVSSGSLNETARTALEANYVKRYESKLNWWFPEGNKCDPESPGYKRFYYSSWMVADALRDCPGIEPGKLNSIFAPLLWPFDSSHWGTTWKFLLYRELPAPLQVDGREMEVWIRRDIAPLGGDGGAISSGPVKLVAQTVIGSPAELAGPSAAAIDAKGNLYVANTNSHNIQIFDPTGKLLKTIGSQGSGDGQFLEPRGIALDTDGNIYVADTWNARVVKLDPNGTFITSWGSGREDFGNGRRASPSDGTLAGNASQPLEFFGPRGIAVDDQGNVYVADTGNKRIVVTDSNGNFLYQWGEFGSANGQFSEPIGVAIAGNTVYVGDTWNGRVQVFIRGGDGKVAPTPIATWRVPGWQPQTYDDPFITANATQVAVSIPGRHTILLTDTTGKELLRWGGQGNDVASLQLPSGLSFAPDGTLFVVDRGNSRIMQFKLPLVAP